jgi:hypothetical protein
LNAISAGCVEGAVISGRDAARALIGRPLRIVGDWLTEVRPELLAEPLLTPRASAAPVRDAFIRRPFELSSPPPYVAKRSLAQWYFFRADARALASLCDLYLNHAGSPTRYVPLAPVVAFVASKIEACFPARERLGFLPEQDFGFWIPVRASATKDGTRAHVASPIAWFQPCLWVDSGPAASEGREFLGFNKMLAHPHWPSAHAPAYAVDTLALSRHEATAEDIDPTLECAPQRVLELWPHEDSSSSTEALTEAGRLLAHGPSSLVPSGLGELTPLVQQLAQGTVPLVALKQLPECDGSARACYKAVVETPTRATRYRGFRARVVRYELRLFPLASHAFAESFGLVTEPAPAGVSHSASCRSFLALEADFDFVVEPGRVVFDVLRG